MAGRLRQTVVLVGMMGSGKSAVGRTLAARLGVNLLDSDAEIEAAARATIAEIFAEHGESFFRDREAEVIERLLAGPPVVLATGGGAWLSERVRAAVGRAGVSVWLDADVDLLWQRVRHKTTRPLLHTEDPKGTLRALHDARRETYALADLTVRSREHYSLEDMTDTVLAALRRQTQAVAA